MFDETATKVLGKSAKEMADIRANDEVEFRRILQKAKYKQFVFSVKTTMEVWNDENRLRMTVMNAEPVNYSAESNHIKRIKAEIESLQS